ncbi:hypothetical protein [Cognatilysobacter bugurensis]|uniref:Uncharacterized protein n=1 Tax=Cognatilysobacter bugurensis TaxID=543356 RepID=A0A918W7D3_9GAMM|nr:hypothetical protein [Lysobacter bugurensis]GHA73618.1 hypothetical protein GCM10007067_08010 [Lysobacter bugurensis]
MRPLPLLLMLALSSAAQAQQTTVLLAENVRFAYAQVLRVTPVYQTLTATRMETQCDQSPNPEGDNKLSRVVGAVKDAWRRNQSTTEGEENCRSVPVAREFRRPIAYDVDYTYRGAKYRSRLPEDPGNRLRIRVSVVPVMPGVRTP